MMCGKERKSKGGNNIESSKDEGGEITPHLFKRVMNTKVGR